MKQCEEGKEERNEERCIPQCMSVPHSVLATTTQMAAHA